MDVKTHEQPSSPAASEKRAYTPPQLQRFGSVRELTAGGSNAGIENNPFGCGAATVGQLGPCPKP